MIYTSYFAKLKSLPENVTPISICGKAPDWYKGAQYKKLAPKFDFFMKWKETQDNDYYVEHFQNEVLNTIKFDRTLMQLHLLLPYEVREKIKSSVWTSPDYHIALICYEKPGDFCHRHLVADWLKNNGVECKEYEFKTLSEVK